MSGQRATGHVETLPSDASLELLSSQSVGRVAFVLDGRPVILPVNYAVDGWTIVFRTTHGGKLVAASSGALVAFEADSFDRQNRVGWSVVARGTLRTCPTPNRCSDTSLLSDERNVWGRFRTPALMAITCPPGLRAFPAWRSYQVPSCVPPPLEGGEQPPAGCDKFIRFAERFRRL
jgi:hypothetical protein